MGIWASMKQTDWRIRNMEDVSYAGRGSFPYMFKMSWLLLIEELFSSLSLFAISAICYFYFFFYSCPFFFSPLPFFLFVACSFFPFYSLFLISFLNHLLCWYAKYASIFCFFFIERYGIFFIVSAFEKCGSQGIGSAIQVL